MRAWTPRRGVAGLLVIAWLFGFELAPAVHVGFHALWSHHQHHRGSARVTSSRDRLRDRGHRRDHGHHNDHHHDRNNDNNNKPADNPGRDRSADHQDAADRAPRDRSDDPAHGSGSLAHRDLTSLPAPLPLLVPAVALAGAADLVAFVGHETPRARMPAARQRGPPSLLLATHI